MPEEKWYQNPEKASQAAAAVILALAALLTWLFAGEEVKKKCLPWPSAAMWKRWQRYFRSFGAWAMLISFLLDVLINAGSIFPSIFISTANGLIFGLPLGIVISWLAENNGRCYQLLADALSVPRRCRENDCQKPDANEN